jgi:predicted transcriptional regulator
MKYRSRIEIVAQVLEAAVGGATKTKIMYKAFLSYERLREYLSLLVNNGLIVYDERTLEYKTTERGTRFLKLYGQLDETRMVKHTNEM